MRAKNNDGMMTGTDELAAQDSPHWQVAERVARSSVFARAVQLRTIFLYIVRQAILKPDEPIHEFEIAFNVLGRGGDFNPLDDNIVRVQMARLRKRLKLYFTTEGKSEETVITVGLGSYKPVFSPRTKAATEALPVPDAENALPGEPAEDVSVLPTPTRIAAAPFAASGASRSMTVGLIVVIVVLAAGWITAEIQNRAMRRSLSPWRYSPAVAALWSGFLEANQNTDLVLSDTSFAMLQKISRQTFSLQDYVSRGYLSQLQSQAQVESPDIRSVLSRVSAQDLGNLSVFRLAERILALDPHSKKIHIYHAREYTPEFIKQDNVILLGSRIANPWQELFASRLNFSLESDNSDLGTIVNRTPAAGEQEKYVSADALGYCVVAYLPNPDDHGKVLLIEGTSSEATEAAGDFLLSEDNLSSFLKKLHATQFPYFEVLLKTSQVRGTPLTTALITYRTYPNLH